MDEMKIEWVLRERFSDPQDGVSAKDVQLAGIIPVVRLAAVDEVIGQAVKWAEMYMQESESSWARLGVLDPGRKDVNYVQAEAFLSSPTVTGWRARQAQEEKR